MSGPRRFGLGPKAVSVLLAVALAPLIAAAVLIDQMAEVAQNFASNQAARLRPPLDDAKDAYRELIASKKRLYRQVAAAGEARIAARLASPVPAPGQAGGARPPAADAGDILRRLLAEEPDLLAASAELDGAVVARVERSTGEPGGPERYRILEVDSAGAGRVRVRLTFAADLELADRFQDLGRVLAEGRQVDSMRSALPASYRAAFLAVLGGVVLIASATGIILARRLTRRIDLLVAGTRKVASGDLSTRVSVGGRDELGELGGAFDRMVEELADDRDHILYLQRMAAWQDVARRLAHEIKNPLTPIQLAVQQLHSSYAGDDERFRRLLADASEIVGEEIASLRRLVDAFRELGRLPDVDPQPLDLALVLDDLRRDPGVVDHLELRPPAAPVMVHGDRLLLRRVVANLVENGIHAGHGAARSGRVVVGWAIEGGRALLTVDDEGPGVAAADRERIFEPYVTTKATGTGLGLAIARKIALEHHGDLTCAAEPAPTGGARFALVIPLAVPAP